MTEPQEYRSSFTCLVLAHRLDVPTIYTLKCTADDYKSKFGTAAADTLQRNFYVDDGLKSVATEEDAVVLVRNVKRMCSKGGFNLTKFVSNSVKVIQSIPFEDRARDIKELELGQDKLPIERALGVHWCVQSDSLEFRIELKDQPCTKREILATISSVYDPLGRTCIATVVLVGKQLLEDICPGTDLDEPVPRDVYARWEKWRSEVFLLDQVNVQRSFTVCPMHCEFCKDNVRIYIWSMNMDKFIICLLWERRELPCERP